MNLMDSFLILKSRWLGIEHVGAEEGNEIG